MSGGKLLRRLASQSLVGPDGDVGSQPVFGNLTHPGLGVEDVGVQDRFTIAAVEAFNVGVPGRLVFLIKE